MICLAFVKTKDVLNLFVRSLTRLTVNFSALLCFYLRQVLPRLPPTLHRAPQSSTEMLRQRRLLLESEFLK